MRRDQLDRVMREEISLPVPSTMNELLVFAINNVDFLDVMYPVDREGYFELWSQDLVTLVNVDESGTCRVVTVVADGTEYVVPNIPEEIAANVLWGLMAHATVSTHFYGQHYQGGAALASLSSRLLPMTHPIRQVLAPTELGVNEVLGKAITVLIGRSGVIAQCFPSYDLAGLVKDHRHWDPLDLDDYRTHLLQSSPEQMGTIVRDYRRWWTYIQDHMTLVVDELYPTEASMDAAVIAWARDAATLIHGCTVTTTITKERVTTLLASTFFAQVRHNFLSNRRFGHVLRWYYILKPGPTSMSQAISFQLTASTTSVQWVPLVGRGFEHAVCHDGARRKLTEFFSGLCPTGEFARLIEHPLALPSEIEISPGV
jgi:hypothetical protein